MSNSVRNFLASMGANLKNIDSSFSRNDYGDSYGNRLTAANIEQVDYNIRKILNPPTTAQPTIHDISSITPINFIQQPNFEIQEMKPSREERINKLIGKSIPNVGTNIDIPTVEAFKKALAPVTEQLEDIAVLNGLIIQRLEQLISIVNDDNPPMESFPKDEEFDDNSEPIEVYNPDVSMSFTEDDEIKNNSKSPKKK